MKIIADTHLHFYSCYDAGVAIAGLDSNLARLAPEAVKTGFLTERKDSHFFRDLADGVVKPEGLVVDESGEGECLVLSRKDKPPLYLFDGKQFVSSERVEVLGLACNIAVVDDVPAFDIVKMILAAGGIPVLSWAPGKWLFSRGDVVRRIVDGFDPGQLLFGDIAMRAGMFGQPSLMGHAQKKGLSIISGSDPLPFAGDDSFAGTYCSLLEGEFNPASPVTSVRSILGSKGAVFESIGKRCTSFQALLRLGRNASSRT